MVFFASQQEMDVSRGDTSQDLAVSHPRGPSGVSSIHEVEYARSFGGRGGDYRDLRPGVDEGGNRGSFLSPAVRTVLIFVKRTRKTAPMTRRPLLTKTALGIIDGNTTRHAKK